MTLTSRSALVVALALAAVGCSKSSSSSPVPTVPTTPLKVAIMDGEYFTTSLQTALQADPSFDVTIFNGCELATFKQFDVIWTYGNTWCWDGEALSSFVREGGGLVATPWVLSNNNGLAALPVEDPGIDGQYDTTLQVTVTSPSDPLLAGVTFVAGDSVAYEDSFDPWFVRTGAVESVRWNDATSAPAVVRWGYGTGRTVYLNFHYVTSDCQLAGEHGWGRQLAKNATLWAGKR